jgi:hypothetical protein
VHNTFNYPILVSAQIDDNVALFYNHYFILHVVHRPSVLHARAVGRQRGYILCKEAYYRIHNVARSTVAHNYMWLNSNLAMGGKSHWISLGLIHF